MRNHIVQYALRNPTPNKPVTSRHVRERETPNPPTIPTINTSRTEDINAQNWTDIFNQAGRAAAYCTGQKDLIRQYHNPPTTLRDAIDMFFRAVTYGCLTSDTVPSLLDILLQQCIPEWMLAFKSWRLGNGEDPSIWQRRKLSPVIFIDFICISCR